ncbi:cyclic lactone autoinducer peptide [Paenibacillus sp. 1P07SE]
MKKKLAYRVATMLSALAVMLVSTASIWYVNQPEVPAELLE